MSPRGQVAAGSGVSGPSGPPVRARLQPPRLDVMARPRLSRAMVAPHQAVCLVVAPAGSGKTSLLAQWRAEEPGATAWYRASGEDRHPRALLAYLHGALGEVVAGLGPPWPDVPAALDALDAPRPAVLLVIDDLHHLDGTPAQEALAELLDLSPPWLAFALAGRRRPTFDVSRRLVAGEVVELGPDDLRFRCWEAEALLGGHLGTPVPPEDVAAVARRTEGWAAGLQLFHLATRGGPPSLRRRVLDGLATRTSIAGEYLTHNVLAGLPEELSAFLVATSVLGHLTGPLCDELLSRRGSAARLRELEHRQILTVPVDEAGAYRYHEVLRSYLELVLVEQVGEAGVRCRYRRAAQLLAAEGHLTDAARAYSRAGDWDRVRRLLGDVGTSLVDKRAPWIDALPPPVADDPWLLLTRARREVGAGRLEAAGDLYRRAEREFDRGALRSGVTLARRERLAAAAWVDPAAPVAPAWHGRILAALRGDPGAQATDPQPEDVGDRLARAVAALLAGDAATARSALVEAAEDRASPPAPALTARTLAVLAGAVAGRRPEAGTVEALADEADELQLRSHVAVARALLALTRRPDGVSEAAAARLASLERGDRWGAALAGLLQGLGAAARDHPGAAVLLAGVGDELAQLGAASVEAWCRWGVALAGGGAEGIPGARRRAELAAARAGAPGARAALASLLATAGSGPARLGDPPPSVALRCLGGLRLERDSVPADLSAVKPRHLSALRILAYHGDRGVHRDRLAAWLWPEADAAAAARNVHVAISTLRRALPAGVGIAREGGTYRLALPPGSTSDVVELDRALAEARAARGAGGEPREVAAAALERVGELYGGELLPEEGAAEWVVEARRERVWEVAAAGRELAGIRLARGDLAGATAACEASLGVDPDDDRTWRVLAEAHRAGGDHVALARVHRRYRARMAELDVAEPRGPVLGAGVP